MADTNIEIKLKDVRLSFDNLFEPQVQEGDKVDPNTGQKVKDISYNCVLLLDKVTHADQIKAVTEAMVAAREAKWPGQNKKIPAERRCMRDGEPEIDGTREPLYDGYKGQMYISAKKKVKSLDAPNPLQLIGPRKEVDQRTGEKKFRQLTPADALLYGGCYVNAIIRIYAYDGSKDKNPDRINASLEVVQHKRHGEPFGAKRVDANSAMDEEEGEDDAFASPATTDDDDPLG